MTASRQPEAAQRPLEHPDVDLLDRLERILEDEHNPVLSVRAVLAAVREAQTEEYVHDRWGVLEEYAVETERGDVVAPSLHLPTTEHHVLFHRGGHVVGRTQWTGGWKRRGQ